MLDPVVGVGEGDEILRAVVLAVTVPVVYFEFRESVDHPTVFEHLLAFGIPAHAPVSVGGHVHEIGFSLGAVGSPSGP